ncbi:MAG: class I SAM-dependent methyltransferase [Alphaproteobacteria bacterium]
MSGTSRQALEKDTGKLFGDLWGPYDQQAFEHSVVLFTRRLDIMGFERGWFKDKTVLDAGCGGGRNTIAMARLGAREAQGIDLGAKGIEDAKRRAHDLGNANFQIASIQDIPFEDNKFDMAWCAGVLMITDNENEALDELTRVVKKGGLLYLLVYATEGMRWPLIELLRPLAKQIGQDAMECAMQAANATAAKRRTFLDDLYCPKLDFYHWDRLCRMLEARGFAKINRLGEDVRLDHEHNLKEYRIDLEALLVIFEAGKQDGFKTGDNKALFEQAHAATKSVIDSVKWFETEVAAGKIPEQQAMQTVIGQGHHRVLATKG